MSAPSFNAARLAIETYLVTNWGTTWSLIYENQPDPPNRTATWVRVSVRPTSADSADVGANMLRVIGEVYFQVFTPYGKGNKQNTDVGDHIAALFNQNALSSTVGPIIFGNAQPIFVGQTEAGNLQSNFAVDYRIDS